MARLLTRDEAARFIGYSPRTLRRWVAARFLRVYYSEDAAGVALYRDAELVRARERAEVALRYRAGWGRGNYRPDPDWPTLWDEG